LKDEIKQNFHEEHVKAGYRLDNEVKSWCTDFLFTELKKQRDRIHNEITTMQENKVDPIAILEALKMSLKFESKQ